MTVGFRKPNFHPVPSSVGANPLARVRILDIDTKKLRRNREVVIGALGDRLAEVGSISKARVKAAIESGGVSPEEFAGAFEKSVRESLRVSKGPATMPDGGPAAPF